MEIIEFDYSGEKSRDEQLEDEIIRLRAAINAAIDRIHLVGKSLREALTPDKQTSE